MRKILPLLLIAATALAHTAEVFVQKIERNAAHTELHLDTGQVLVVDAVITNEIPLPASLVYRVRGGTNWLIFLPPAKPPVKVAVPPLREPIRYVEVHYD